MKTARQPSKRQCINIDKSDYNVIKQYCDTNALNLPKWIVKLALETINSKKQIS